MPALTVVAVGDVELRARVLKRRIGARERGARFDELILAKEREAIRERLRVDRIHANR